MQKRILFILLGCFLVCADFVSAAQGPMTTDQMLDYTLQQLRQRMGEIIENNNKTVQKSEVLRKRIFTLRDEIRQRENYKLQLLEDAQELKDMIRLDSEEKAMEDAKVDDIHTLKKNRLVRQEDIQGQIRAAEKRQEKLEKEIADLHKELPFLREKKATGSVKDLQRQVLREKKQCLRMIGDIQKQKERLERRIFSQDARLESPRAHRVRLLGEQEALEQRKKKAHEVYQGEIVTRRLLEDDDRKYKQQRRENIQRAKEEIDHIRLYLDELVKNMQACEKIKATIASGFPGQRQFLERQKNLLEKYHQRLLIHEAKAQQVYDSAQALKTSIEQGLEMSDAQRTIDERKTQEEKAGEELLNKIKAAQQTLAGYDNQQESLERDIKEMERQIKRLTFVPKKERQRKSRQMTEELNKLIREQERKNPGMEKKISPLQREIEKHQDSFIEEERTHRSLQTERKLGEEALAGLRVATKDLTKGAQDLKAGPSLRKEQFYKEINSLRMQREALVSSLAVIESQYNEDLPAIEEFSRDERALREYLDLLREENNGLKQKLFTLETQFKNLSEKTRRQTSQ